MGTPKPQSGSGCHDVRPKSVLSDAADHQDRLLDEALEGSFPASDPPALTQRDH